MKQPCRGSGNFGIERPHSISARLPGGIEAVPAAGLRLADGVEAAGATGAGAAGDGSVEGGADEHAASPPEKQHASAKSATGAVAPRRGSCRRCLV